MAEYNKTNKELVNTNLPEEDVSIYAYDLSIVRDLRVRFRKDKENPKTNPNIQISPTDTVFKVLGQMDDDKIVMPMITLQRIGWYINEELQEDQLRYGQFIKEIPDPDFPGANLRVNAQIIPITINYQIDIWTRERVTNDAIIRELLFYYKLRPTLLVNVKHGLDFQHTFNIYFNTTVEDNSDIVNHQNNGQFFRQSLTFFTEGSYLWKSRYEHEVISLGEDLFFYDNDNEFKDENLIRKDNIKDIFGTRGGNQNV